MLGDEETEVLGLATKSSDFSYEGLYAQVQVVSRIYSYENTLWDIVGRHGYRRISLVRSGTNVVHMQIAIAIYLETVHIFTGQEKNLIWI